MIPTIDFVYGIPSGSLAARSLYTKSRNTLFHVLPDVPARAMIGSGASIASDTTNTAAPSPRTGRSGDADRRDEQGERPQRFGHGDGVAPQLGSHPARCDRDPEHLDHADAEPADRQAMAKTIAGSSPNPHTVVVRPANNEPITRAERMRASGTRGAMNDPTIDAALATVMTAPIVRCSCEPPPSRPARRTRARPATPGDRVGRDPHGHPGLRMNPRRFILWTDANGGGRSIMRVGTMPTTR